MQPGTLVWVYLGDPVGREQRGRRPALVISSSDHLEATSLVTLLPCTTRYRGWGHHVPMIGAGTRTPTFAMTEQVRTVSRARIGKTIGQVDRESLRNAMEWVSRWMAFPR